MSDEKTVMERAIARRDMLRAQLAEVEKFIEVYNALIGDSEAAASEGSTPSVMAPSVASGLPHKVKKTSGIVKGIADMAEKAILETNRPMPRGELVEWIEQHGMPINSLDKPRYIGTILWRNSDRFENIEGQGYWIKGHPIPEAYTSLFGENER